MNAKHWLIVVVGLLTAVGSAAPAAGETPSGKVLVFAAASTTDAVEDILTRFDRRNRHVFVRVSFASSSALARQIEAGAAADVFLSASADWADYLEQKELVAARRQLLGNRLVVVVPADSKLKLSGPDDLSGGDVRRLALADPSSVPAGIYARHALEKLRVWKEVRGKVAGAADVRQALQFVATGAADAGIVYATDAAIDKRVRVALKLSDELSGPIRYPLVLLKRGEGNAAARAFYEYLAGPEAARVFERYGFVILGTGGGKPREAEPCGD